MTPELCPCGEPLHYKEPKIQRMVERMIGAYGANISVQVGSRAYMVPRHWIALHGLKPREVPILADKYGWEEVKA